MLHYNRQATNAGEHKRITTMNHKKINNTILQIKKLEGKAMRLQLQLDKIKDKWESKMETVRNTEEWKRSCHESDMDPNYNFGDVLA